MSDPADPLRPTVAAPEPTPTVPPAQGTTEHPAGTAAPPAEPAGSPAPADLQAKVEQLVHERPEALVGGGLVGGFLAAIILKRITGGGR